MVTAVRRGDAKNTVGRGTLDVNNEDHLSQGCGNNVKTVGLGVRLRAPCWRHFSLPMGWKKRKTPNPEGVQTIETLQHLNYIQNFQLQLQVRSKEIGRDVETE